MPSGLSSPRSRASVLADLGERSAFVDGQRVGRPRRRRPSRRTRLRRLVGVIVAVAVIPAAGVGRGHWLLTPQRYAGTNGGGRGASRTSPQQILAGAAIPLRTDIFPPATTGGARRGGRGDPRAPPKRERADRGDLGDRHEPPGGPGPLYGRRRRSSPRKRGLGGASGAPRRGPRAGRGAGRANGRPPVP